LNKVTRKFTVSLFLYY